MAILDTHISGEQLRMPSRVDAGRPFRTIGAVAQKIGEIDQVFQNAEDKNALDSATLQAKGALLDLTAQDEANPIANDKNWYSEESQKIVDQGADSVPPNLQGVYRGNMFLPTKKSNIASKARRRTAVSVQGKAILGQELKMVASLPQGDRQAQITKLLTTAGAFKFIDADGATEGYVGAWGNAAEVDASGFDVNGDPRFDEVIGKVADLNDPTYPLEPEDRRKLHDKLKKQKKMVTTERSNQATGAFLDIVADKMEKEIPLTVDDATQFKGMVENKELGGFLKIVAQSKSEARTATRFDQTQLDYYRGEADRLLQEISISPELQKKADDGLLDPDVIRNSKTIPEESKKGLITVAKELKRLQKFEEFETDTELAAGSLDANLDKYSRDSLLIKLATDEHLKTLTSEKKQAIIGKHKQVISKGQNFRSKKDWQTAYGNLLEFRDNMGFVGGVPDTTDQAVMDRRVLQNKQEFAKAEKAFLDRSEFSFRDYSKNPNQPAPDYNSFSENEMLPFRVKDEENQVVKFVKDVASMWGPMAGKNIIEERTIAEEDKRTQAEQQAFETSPETQEFEVYMAEKEQIAQGLVDTTIRPKQKQDEFEVGEVRFNHKYVGDGQWQPLNKAQ